MKYIRVIAFWIPLFVSLIPLSIYFYSFQGALSSEHGRWGEFGSFYGGILGPPIALLAIIGLLWNLDITKKQFRRQNEDNIFFNLIELHNNKVQGISFEIEDKKWITGVQAFKKWIEEFNRIYDLESVRVARVEISRNTDRLTYNAYDFIWGKMTELHYAEGIFSGEEDKKNSIISLFNECSDPWELQKCLIGTDDIIKNNDTKSKSDVEKLIMIGHVVIENSDNLFRINIIKYVNEKFYHDHGHVLGHYFRNIYYILRFIDESESSIKYSKIFRAQFSRYELTALYYNALSALSGPEFIQLLLKYDILNGIYDSDICYFPDEKKRRGDLAFILKEKRQ